LHQRWGRAKTLDSLVNLEQAITAYQQSLTICQQVLTACQQVLIVHPHHPQALIVRAQSAISVIWAASMNNLASAYVDRIRGGRAQNLEDAIAAYNQALTVRTQKAKAADWAVTMNNLASVYVDRIQGGRAQNLEDAIVAYRQALTAFTKTAMPIDWATTMNNLATAYQARIRGERAQNLEDAIAACQQALTVRSQNTMPVAWAATMHNLALTYSERIRGVESENIEQAMYYYNQALEVSAREAFPRDHLRTLRNLAKLYFGERRWAEAYQTCLDAIAVGVDIFVAGIGDAGRLDAIKNTGDLYTWAAYSAIQLGRYGEALSEIEAGKGRLLAEAQSLNDANLWLLAEDERTHLQTLRDQIKGLEYEYRLPIDHPSRRDEQAIIAELGETRTALRNLINDFHARYPGFLPKGLPLVELLALIPANGALVAPLFTDQGSAIFIVLGGVQGVTADNVLMLDDFKLENLNIVTRGTEEKRGWLAHYIFSLFVQSSTQALFDGIDDVTHRLWDAFMGRVHERLTALDIKRVLLMPQGDTALVPLHAAWRDVNGERCYFMDDDFTVSYTPSMVTLATAQHSTAAGTGALVAGVSTYQKMNNLPNTRAEAESIAALLGVSPLLDGAATVDAVRAGTPGKAYLHLSCHGGFGWGEDAFASALYLANDGALSLPQIMAQLDLRAARLVVLSACETGIVDVNNVPDEFVGLAAGFLQAGAMAVVSSLWTVEDRSTALLMERMYKNMIDGAMEPALALRQAQFWLRNATAGEIGAYYQSYLVPRMSQSEASAAFIQLMQRAKPNEKPYAHPFYWAAFTYSGL